MTAGRRHSFGWWGKWVLMALSGVTLSGDGYFGGTKSGRAGGVLGMEVCVLGDRIRANAATGKGEWEVSGEMRFFWG